MSRSRLALTLALSVSSLLGCDLKRSKPHEKAGAPTELTSAAVETGLSAADNDPALVGQAKAALACPVGMPSSWFPLFDTSCPAYKAWKELPLKESARDGDVSATDLTLMNLLEDKNERVRFLGTTALSTAKAYTTHRSLATRLVAAAVTEKDPSLLEPLGERVSRIDVEKTGVLESIVELVKRREQSKMSVAILDHLLFNNSSHRPTYDFYLAMTNDPDPKLREAAVGEFWIGGGISRPETCKMFESHLEDPADSIAGHSAELLGWYHSCATSYEALLGSLERRVKEHRFTSSSDSRYGSAPGKMCKDRTSTAAQKQRAAAVSRAIAADKDVSNMLRGNAIESVVDCDPRGGRAFVARFKNDKSSIVQSSVNRALDPKR